MFRKILVANRGEIAVRVIRACRDLGVISAAVYSEADREALHAQIADEAVCIGPVSTRDSYLSIDRLLSTALAIGADAVHPGYGFLSENDRFAQKCADLGLVFIGPSPEALRLLGDKARAKATARACGVPVIPGSEGVLKDAAHAVTIAADIGYPVMLKAASGGGGKGIRLLTDEASLLAAFDTARAEALANFGDGGLYLEKAVLSPRHIEFQVLGDAYGTVVHLFERECSIQRRHQKMIEESPSPFLDDALRAEMGAAAVRLAKAAGYTNAGTIEFLVSPQKEFFFMEMNPRIQVEHPVTESVTGLDLVLEQIRLAAGQPLGYGQQDLIQRGHALECRVCAEDPARGFAPCPGVIVGLNVPGGPGVRVDTAVYQGYRVPPYYDSLLAKLIVHGHSRAQAIARMRRAMAEFLFEGIQTTSDFLLQILQEPDFTAGDLSIDYLETHSFSP